MADGGHAKYHPYPAYKPSGVEWLGDIPEGWSGARLKNMAFINMGQSPSSDECNSDGNGRPFLQGNADFGDKHPAPKSYCDTAKKVASKGEFLFSVRAPVGALNIANQEYGIGRGLCSISPGSLMFHSFLWWVLLVSKPQLNSVSTGSTFEAVSAEQVENCFLAVPTFPEQTKIAAFLDHETAKIDGLIAKQQRLIALLEEKRQAVISHAVTKGLDPTAPLRPSGIDWLGDIPAHWEVLSLNRIIDQFVDYRGKTPTKTEEGIPLITATQIKRGVIDHMLDPVYISHQEYRERMTRGFPSKGDLLLTTEAPLGEAALIEDELVATGQRIILMKCCAEYAHSEFLLRHFQSEFGKAELHVRSSGSTASGIRADRLRASKVTIPPVDEQIIIAEHINKTLSKFRTLERDALSVITLLKERRTALISAAVTGKIDLRDWQAPEGGQAHSSQDSDQQQEALA